MGAIRRRAIGMFDNPTLAKIGETHGKSVA
jgi:hypothetical protein